MNVRQLAKRSPLAPVAAFPARARAVTSHQWHQARRSWAWLVGSREFTNFTYELTTENVVEMAWFVAAVTGLGFDESFRYTTATTATTTNPLRTEPWRDLSRRVRSS